jgi:hypothetical protein
MRRCCLLLIWAASSAAAQRPTTGALVGRVFDAQSRAALAGAELVIASKDRRATADSTGGYRFSELPGGVYAIAVRRLGYQQLTQDISVIVGAESETDFRLTRVVTLDTVESKAAAPKYISPALRGFEERKKMGNGYFLDEAFMRKSDDRQLANTLRRIPGVQIVASRTSAFVASGRTGGSGEAGAMRSPAGNKVCFVSVYLDGLAIYTGPPLVPPDMNKLYVRDIAAAEFYPGSAALPVQFSAIKSSDCGVLLLWTRER